MKKESWNFLTRLLNSISPSGYEEDAAVIWAKEARAFADEVYGDQHGNVYATVNKGGSPRVMLAGHLDEIGMMISHIDKNGYLNFMPIGGWDPQILQGQRVRIKTKKGIIKGVIGKKPIHKIKQKDREHVTKIEDLWIDIGAKNKMDAEKHITVGDPAVLAYEAEELLNGRIVSRAMDDKAGAFVILEAARMLSGLDIHAEVVAVATVQEEIGLRGVTTSCYTVDPAVGIAVDVTFATDFPSMDQKQGEVNLDKGPTVSRGPNFNHALFDLILKTSRAKKIPCQIEPAPRGTGTDANQMQITRAGVATALVGIPNRYMHSPCEIVSKKDLENTARLIAQSVAAITPQMTFCVKL
ncbi:MAG: M42 family peptidase [Spartobacteria bacterium]|nr:M42 family peptidase [Spartobacteria bacterium]